MKSRLRWAAAAGVAALITVAVALGIAAGPRPVTPLPAYSLVIEGDPLLPASTFAGGSRLLFKPGGSVTIKAKPDQPLRGKVDVRASISVPDRAGGRYYPLETWLAKDGTVTISGRTEQVFDGVAPGSYQLAIEIERPMRASEPGGSVALTRPVEWKAADGE